MIAIQARGWQQFLAAFGILRAAGVEPVAVGGNQMRVAADTGRTVLRAVAATGAVVHADLTEHEPEAAAVQDDTEAPEPEPEQPEEPDGGDTSGSSDVEVPDTKPQVDTPPETQAPTTPRTRTPRKATTRRKTKEQ